MLDSNGHQQDIRNKLNIITLNQPFCLIIIIIILFCITQATPTLINLKGEALKGTLLFLIKDSEKQSVEE